MVEHPPEPDWLPEELTSKAEWLPAKGDRPEGEYISFGGPVGRTVAALRFFGPDLDPSQVTQQLGCEPTEHHRKGDPVDRRGRGARSSGSWRLKSTLGEDASIDEHIAHLLARVTADRATWSTLAVYQPDIFVGVFLGAFNQGDGLSPESARLLADRGIRLNFDIYSCPREP